MKYTKIFRNCVMMGLSLWCIAFPLFAAGEYAQYGKGCIYASDEEIRRLGIPIIAPKPHVTSSSAASAAAGGGGLSLSAGITSLPSPEARAKLPLRHLLEMSPAKHQCQVGSCASFAVIAALEGLALAEGYPGTVFSETELFLRMVTLGAASRADEGTRLHEYLTLVRKGVVLNEQFIPYETYYEYVSGRRSTDKKTQLAAYTTFKESIDHLAATHPRSVPEELKPVWRTVEKYVFLSGMRSTVVSDGYWSRLHFNPFIIQTSRNEEYIIRLKYLLTRVPIVISVATFVQKERDAMGNIITETDAGGNKRDKIAVDYWGREYLRPRAFVIDVPGKGADYDGNHAICLCGYDDRRSAFRLKNSWGTGWGEGGFAWITYPYILTHGSSAITFISHPEIKLDIDALTDANYEVLSELFLRRTVR